MDPDAPVPPRRKSKQREKNEGGDDAPEKHECRFCDMKFDKSQALGGHMNRHRQERGAEELHKARMLLVFREQHFGRLLYDMQGGFFPGTLHQGGDIEIPNRPLVGESSRPRFPSNQQSLQNMQLNQLLQTSYSLQSQSQAPGGSFYSSQNSPPPQPHQLRFNPGQHQMAQGQPGADFGSHSQGAFQMEPSPLDEVVLGSNLNNVALRSNFQYPFVNTLLAPPLNKTHFHYQKPGSSAMGGLEAVVNQAIQGGHHMQPSFEDRLQPNFEDDYRGNYVVDAAAGAVIEGSKPEQPDHGTDHIQADGYQGGKDVVDALGATFEGSEP